MTRSPVAAASDGLECVRDESFKVAKERSSGIRGWVCQRKSWLSSRVGHGGGGSPTISVVFATLRQAR